jgi:hypothetical protein
MKVSKWVMLFLFQFKILKGMLQNFRGLRRWCCKDCRATYRLWKWRIVKQNESDGVPKFTTTIELGGKSTSYWKLDKRKSWKWRRICRAYKSHILEFDVGQTNVENKEKAYGAHVICTTKSGMARHMDYGSSEKAKF